jgi:formylglycine-generating enzyme required for sulfatase activity
MSIKRNALDLTGYRMPTEAEWEYACRAHSITNRHYGDTLALLPQYGRYLENSEMRVWPVASLKPNDAGLFDMLGNAFEWCLAPYKEDLTQDQTPASFLLDLAPITDDRQFVHRGGAYNTPQLFVRSASRRILAANRGTVSGIRLARTCP